jgi:hypothetical protein
VAAGLPTGEAVVREITGHRYDMAMLAIPDSGHRQHADLGHAAGRPAPRGRLRQAAALAVTASAR